MKKVVGVAAALLMTVGLNLVDDPPAQVLGVQFAAVSDTGEEDCFRAKTNTYREAQGRKPLAVSMDMTKIARRHSVRMAAADTIFHNDENDSDGRSLPEEYGKPFRALGENVGMGDSCDALMEAFKDSPGHNENLLDPDYEQLGVGVTIDSDGTVFVTLDFLTPASTPPAKKPQPKCTCP